MSSTRDRSLDAAVRLIGEQGIRALTHARVDERAGLPRGSTSNWFRTRAALVAGVITWIAENERDDLPAAAEGNHLDLVAAFTAMVDAETGRYADRSRARLALFLEAAADRDLLAPLLAQREVFVRWVVDLLADAGATDPDGATRALMAGLDGLVLHRLTVDPDAPIGPTVARLVTAARSG